MDEKKFEIFMKKLGDIRCDIQDVENALQELKNANTSTLEKSCHTCAKRFKCIDHDKGGCVEWK